MAAPRTYTDAQRSDALVRLAANGGALRRTARETGIPETTLRQWSKGDRAPQAGPLSAQKLRPAAEDCDRVAAKILDYLESVVDRHELKGAATVFGIMVDKAILLRQAAPPEEAEQPIDLSRLTPDQLETLNGWLEREDGSALNDQLATVHPEGCGAGQPVGGSVPVDGSAAVGGDQADPNGLAGDGVDATSGVR